MTINGKVATATLDDTPAAREFASLLPLTLTLTDYASTEKVSDLPRRLSKVGAAAGYEPSAGDITYYAPWGNLAIFYRDFRYSRGLIRLGTIDSGVEALNQPGPLRTTIEILYVDMKKRTGRGTEYPPEQRNGEWEYQAFNADKSVNRNERLDRCFSCHKSQAANDFVFTLGEMESAR